VLVSRFHVGDKNDHQVNQNHIFVLAHHQFAICSKIIFAERMDRFDNATYVGMNAHIFIGNVCNKDQLSSISTLTAIDLLCDSMLFQFLQKYLCQYIFGIDTDAVCILNSDFNWKDNAVEVIHARFVKLFTHAEDHAVSLYNITYSQIHHCQSKRTNLFSWKCIQTIFHLDISVLINVDVAQTKDQAFGIKIENILDHHEPIPQDHIDQKILSQGVFTLIDKTLLAHV